MSKIDNKKIIALKYAKAFVNLYIETISVESFNNIKKLENFFDTHKKAIYFLSVPNIKKETKLKLLNEIFEKFKLDNLLAPLIKILTLQKRLFLIDEILKNIRLLYKERKNIMTFKVISSHQISKEDLEIIEKFLEVKTGKKIIYYYNLDKSLIAGIKLKSSTLLWEYSIFKQCENLRKQFNI
jgi:F-type H+-transporting ATPase subunit delta